MFSECLYGPVLNLFVAQLRMAVTVLGKNIRVE